MSDTLSKDFITEPLLILTGAYGSGKTECAMRLAEMMAHDGPVDLVDLDFVTPYFRSQDHREEMASLGVRVIAPGRQWAALDAPAIPPEATESIIRPAGKTVVDLGGDPAGAIVIAQYAPRLGPYDFWAVVNGSRPETSDVASAAGMLREIVASSRLHLSGIISNTHLGDYTSEEDILTGISLSQGVGEELGIPVRLVAVREGLVCPNVPYSILALRPRVRPPW